MSQLKVITNTVWRDCAQVKVTDLADAATADTAQPLSIIGGGRHLKYIAANNGARRFLYLNRSGTLSADTMVATGMTQHLGHTVIVNSFTSYPGAGTSHFLSTTFAQTLVGKGSDDWVYDFGSVLTSKQAFTLELDSGTGGAYTKTVNRIYFGTSFSFSYGTKTNERTISPYWSSITLKRQNYLLSERCTFTATRVTRTELQTFENLYHIREEPCFFYDSTGVFFADYLWHCIVADVQSRPTFDNMHDVTFTLLRLRHY